jgi:hypothetical protein
VHRSLRSNDGRPRTPLRTSPPEIGSERTPRAPARARDGGYLAAGDTILSSGPYTATCSSVRNSTGMHRRTGKPCPPSLGARA